MKTEHHDIRKIIPYGDQIRGFANQKFLTEAELSHILRERGIFVLGGDKDNLVSLLQTLLISPAEFDKIREAFSEKEDNVKVVSRVISLNKDAKLLDSNLIQVEVEDFLKHNLPTCKLQKAIRFAKVDDDENHVKAEINIERKDLNKSWYEQTNEFGGSVEFICNPSTGEGSMIISYTAIEVKNLAEHVGKRQVEKFKEKNLISPENKVQKILFNKFSNASRFAFFFKLTSQIECPFLSFNSIKNISIKPADTTLPEDIHWMENINKILLSGEKLDDKFFIEDTTYHEHLILWSMEALFEFDYLTYKGFVSVEFGFPDYNSQKASAEFEINIANIKLKHSISLSEKNKLKRMLLSELDKEKTVIYKKTMA